MNKHYKTLGLDKILDMLSKKTSSEDSRKKALSILPAHDINTVNQLIKETSDAHMLIARYKGPSFNGLNDIKVSVQRAKAGATLSTVELLKIAQTVYVFNSLYKFREQFSSLKTSLDVRFNRVIQNKYIENKIKSSILSEDEIADTASTELLEIRKKICRSSDKVRDQLDKMLRSQNIQKYLQENIVTIKSGRFVLPVKAEFKKNISGLVHETSSSGATLFIEPMSVVDANNEIKILRQKEKNEIDKILKNLSSEVGGFADDILISYDVCVELDVIFAKADLAYSMRAISPKINNQGKINLKNARHPLINKEKIVPTNIFLGDKFDTLVITGPNTGGKTVSLKTIGLFTLMAMCGLMIPANEGSEVSVFEHILSDIGDEQSIEQSLSTFSAHMVNIIDILNTANDKSLILLDELGAGTDPVEGAALAISILENLREKGTKVVATTHYAELKAYAISTLRVENACCEFDVETLKPTYNLLIGMPGRSNAFAISRKLGMPEDIVSNAQEFVSSEDSKFEEVVKSLEISRLTLEKEKTEIEKLKKQIQQDATFISKEKEKLKSQCEDEIKIAKAKSESLVSRATAMANELLEEVKKAKKASNNVEMIKKIKSDLNEIERTIDPVEKNKKTDYKLPRKLKIGDNVLIIDIDKKGTILDITSNGDMATVQAGIIKTRVPVSNIRLLDKEPIKKTFSINTGKVKNKMMKVTRELDVRGQTALEAIIELDNFIDNAVLSNVHQLTVIHGKGTGVLRTEISKHLKNHPNVKSSRLGTFGEGESGVTIIELK